MSTEVWKAIYGFAGYEVSNLGRVRGVDRLVRCSRGPKFRLWKGRVLQHRTQHGYRYVIIRGVTMRIHKLVARAFVPVPKRLKHKPKHVNHTGAKTDNRATKLEWLSVQEHGKDIARREQRGDGVHFDTCSGKWKAVYYPLPNKQKHIGVFTTKAQALAARRALLEVPCQPHQR